MDLVAEPARDSSTHQWVSFVLGGERHAVDVMRVKEVLKVGEITPVSGAPGFVLGVINLRGSVVTVVDARSRFGLQGIKPGEASRIILVDKGQDVVGLLVDRVGQVLNVSPDDIDTTPGLGNGDRNAQGVLALEGELIVMVDLDRLLPDEASLDVGRR